MPRRKKGFDVVEFTKLVLILIFLLAFGLTGSFKATAGIFSGLFQGIFSLLLYVLIALVAFAVILGVILFFFRPRSASPRELAAEEISDFATEPGSDPSSFAPSAPRRTEYFTRALLADLEWRRFEILVTKYFETLGFDARRSRVGADGGVDIILREGSAPELPFAYVQCKSWHVYTVGVKPIRELFGVMAGDGITRGYFVTTASFTTEALEFAKFKPLKLVDGVTLLEKLNDLPTDQRELILAEITSGDYTTPTCPQCDIKLIRRSGKTGDFWGCRNFPRCRHTFPIREAA